MKKKRNTNKRKNYFSTLIITTILWLSMGMLIYFTDPQTPLLIPIFFLLIFFAFLFSFSTILTNTKRGFIVSLALTIFLILRILGVGNLLNIVLLLGLVIAFDFYIS